MGGGADRALGLPEYATAGAAGADLRANLPDRGAVTLAPGARALVPTGLRLAIPNGFEVQIRPRSGLALKHGITLPNSPGTIDADYRGPVGVIVMNAATRPSRSHMACASHRWWSRRWCSARFHSVESLHDTARGAGGFGSTGTE